MSVVSVTSPSLYERLYTNDDATTFYKLGGDANWRNNNPGNLRFTTWAAAEEAGAIGVDPNNGFAIFSTWEDGESALVTVITDTYGDDSINDMMDSYAPSFENNTAAYQSFLSNKLGVDGSTVISSLSDGQFNALVNGIITFEGTGEGVIVGTPSGGIGLQNASNPFPYNGGLGIFTPLLNSWWATTFSAPKTGSPIILDLDGNGVTTTSESAGTYFDLRNTGFAEKTGWVGPTDGLLVWDRNSNGVIDNGGELFGNYTLTASDTVAANGFAALASYDSNSDGKIDSSDPIWSDLQVWIDANGNGVTDSGELHSLSSLGIQSLNLSDTDEGNTVRDAAGNNPEYVSTFTYTDSTTAAMTDVNFANDTSQTVPLSSVSTTSDIDALPDLPSAGTLYSLHQAMALDTSGDLETLVTDFTTETSITDRNATMENILIDWAGAADVDPTSRNSNGGDFNAQHLAVLEAAMGRSFNQPDWGSNPSDPGSLTAPQLANDYFFFFERTYAELAAQTFLKTYYDEITTSTSGGVTTFDFSAALSDLFSTASDEDIVEFYRTVFASGIPDSQVNYAGLLTSLASSESGLVSEVDTIIAPYYATNLATGVSGDTNIYAGSDGTTIVGGLGGSTIYANVNSYAAIPISNTTVYGNAGTNTIVASGELGVDQIYGGTGDDTIDDNGAVDAGTIIDGGAGDNTLNLDTGTDISQAIVSNIQTLVLNGTAAMTADQFSGFTSLTDDSGTGTVYAAGAGTYDLSSKTVTGSFYLNASATSDDVTLIGDDESSQHLIGGSGTDTLEAGSGSADVLTAGSGSTTLTAGSGGDTLNDGPGVDTLTGGTGNDLFNISYATSGTTVNGGSGTDTLAAYCSDISAMSISGVEKLQLDDGTLKLTATQFGNFSTLDGYGTIYAAGAGTYDLTAIDVIGSPFNLNASETSANVTLIGDDESSQHLTGGTGTDTLQAGNGSGDVLQAGSGDTTLIAGTGNDTLYGGNGTNTYQFGSSFGADTVYNSGTTANGEVAFISGTSDEDLWFQQSGSDLQIDLLGTSEQVTISDWYGGGGNQVASLTADGKTLDSAVSSLVSAMATYAAGHSGFDPTTAGSMPSDTTLQSAIAAAWHT
jgi:RTX calcium-binding nonapeptide repeat (4 copies)